MSRLERLQELAHGQLRKNADVLYRHEDTWSDGTRCRFSVQDVVKADTVLARSLRSRPDASDLRLLKVHPDDPSPLPTSRLVWPTGFLFVERYSQESDFTGTSIGVCRLIDPSRVAFWTLTFKQPGQLATEAGTGNPVELPGPPLQVSARLEANSDPALRAMVGADQVDLVLFGRWGAPGSPLPRPPSVRWGSTSPLTLQGLAGTLTLQTAFPDSDPLISAIHGEPFLATWRSS